MRVIVAVETRADVISIAPLLTAFRATSIEPQIAYRGSHAIVLDAGDSHVSISGVRIPAPEWYLDGSSGVSARSTGASLCSYEQLFSHERPDAVLISGDSNGALAAALAAAKGGLPVVHLGAGVRCGDLAIPGEINRAMISRIAAMHLTPSARALENLEDEGIEPERIHFVGNSIAEQTLRELDGATPRAVVEPLGLASRGYVLAVLNRTDDLADEQWLSAVVTGLSRSELPVVVTDADRLLDALSRDGLTLPAGVRTYPAVEHLQMLSLIASAACVVTDSGGVQEEACVLCTPCVTVSRCTEYSETVSAGATALSDADVDAIASAISTAVDLRRSWAQPARWDKAVSDRVVRALRRGILPLR